MPHLAPAVVAAIVAAGSSAAAGTASVISANKARKQSVKDQTRYDMDSVADKTKQPDDFGSLADSNANLTLRPGGKPIVFNRNRQF